MAAKKKADAAVENTAEVTQETTEWWSGHTLYKTEKGFCTFWYFL
mgnify:FL=1